MNSLLVLLQLLLLLITILECVSAFSVGSRTLSSLPSKSISKTKLFASSADKYNDLIQWFTSSNEQSYISNKVDIRPSSLATGGYGVFANDDLAEGELIFTIPKSCCMFLESSVLLDMHTTITKTLVVSKVSRAAVVFQIAPLCS